MSLKSSKDSSTEQENLSDCWRRERDRTCLRVDISPHEVFIFPYQQFLGAHHVRSVEGETLKITLSTHEVTLCGSHLSEILSALEALEVSWIRAVPGRYKEVANHRGASVTSIEVKAAE